MRSLPGKRSQRRSRLPPRLPRVDDVVVAILTGGRPQLLAQTLGALQRTAGARLPRWDAIALVNGADAKTLEVLKSHPWIQVEKRRGRMRKIGPSVSDLMAVVAASDRRYVLHLEDDWGCMHTPARWLDPAVHVLEENRVGQVRIRSAREKTMRVSMVSGARIRWDVASDHERSANAHMTFNPNVMRVRDLRRVYPCRDEPHAQQKYAALGLDVVQLLPGSFQHLGAQRSLRRQLGGRH